MSYDQLGDLTSQTDPGGGVSTYTYDPAGEQTSVTDPTGAQTQATYDNLGQLITTTDLVRQNTSAAYTTTLRVRRRGRADLADQPDRGARPRRPTTPLGEQTSSHRRGREHHHLRLQPGRQPDQDHRCRTAPRPRPAYDLAGRQISLSDLNATGTVLRTESAVYDADGQRHLGDRLPGQHHHLQPTTRPGC